MPSGVYRRSAFHRRRVSEGVRAALRARGRRPRILRAPKAPAHTFLVIDPDSLAAWLRAHPQAWHGWPARILFIGRDDNDGPRLRALVAQMPDARLPQWFGPRVVWEPRKLFSHLSVEIADLRIAHRRHYTAQIAALEATA